MCIYIYITYIYIYIYIMMMMLMINKHIIKQQNDKVEFKQHTNKQQRTGRAGEAPAGPAAAAADDGLREFAKGGLVKGV